MRKFFRGICGVLATLLTLCILLMAAGLMGVRAFGITPYVVPADMEGLPWSAGALLYVRQEQPETLQPGDTIAYVTDSDLSLEGGRHRFRGHRAALLLCGGSPGLLGQCAGAAPVGHRWAGLCVRLYQPAAGTVSGAGGCCGAGVAVHLPPATPKGKENGRIPHREMYGNECGRESSHRIGAGCGDGGGSPPP